MEKIARRIEEWKAKLIDQTRRNRLLYFRPTRSSTLHVVDPSISNVFDRLVFKEAHWRFYCPEQVDPSEGDFESQASSLILIREHPQRTTPELPARAADELLCSGTDFARIRRTIRSLHRRSRSEFEERGVRILYAAFGMLEWRESANAEICQSPVVLVPVGLERESAREPFKLTFGDEEIVLNPALEAKLQKDFGFHLPTAPDEWEELGIEAYLTKTQEAVAPLGWTVRQECWIATLSFFKLVMYQDLNAHGTLISQHPITQALAGEATLQSGEPVELPDPRQLDDLVPTNDSFLVMDADSSQLACIEAVKRGASLVLQGPPGTGKTQTITNIIAESLASGRKVLFVSEKMAALEQVFERIKAQSLDAYCLELHSHKANKREVVKELERCYRQALQPSSAMTDFELQQLNSRREQLNRYVRVVHQVRAPLNRSVYSVLGELAQLEAVPYVPGGGIPVESLTVSYLDRAGQLAQRLGRLWYIVVEGTAFPWRGCLVQSYSASMQLLGVHPKPRAVG